MEKKYTYYPPIKYLLQIILGFVGGSMFMLIFIYIVEVWWFKVLMIFFSTILYGYSFLFYKRCFYNLIGFKIKLRTNSIVLPFDNKGVKISFNFSDINEIEIYDSFDTEVIEITTSKGSLLIEKSWMRKRQYSEFLKILKNKSSFKA